MPHKHEYTQPIMPEKGYSFVLAGMLHRNFGGYSIYVKYKAGVKDRIVVKQRTNEYLWLICPDRELVMVRNNNDIDAFYPYGDSFDECVDLNMFNDKVCKGLDVEYIMTNFAHNSQARNDRLNSSHAPEDRIQVLSDSGGLQLARGIKTAINPRELIEFYNNNVDAGMILDLPLFFSDKVIAKKAALQQRANNEVMLKYSQGTELINIFHGQTPEERTMFRSIVEDKRIPRVAIGGIANYKPIAGVNSIYDTIEGGLRYKQYHVLGIYTSALIPLMVKMANSSGVHITSDSTSHIQSSLNRTYHFQWNMYVNMKRLAIGQKGTEPNTQQHLPCQCIVCKTIKYTDIFGFGDNRHTCELLTIHNGYEMARYANSLQEYCQNSTPREYNKLIMTQLKKNKELAEVKGALHFIDIVTKHGLKAGQKEYANSIKTRRFIEQVVPKPLFGEHVIPVDHSKEAVLQQLKLMAKAIKEEQ